MGIIGIRKEEDEVQDSSSATHNYGDDKALDVAALAEVTAAQNLLQLSGEGSHESHHKKREVVAYREMNEAEEGCDSSDRSITSRVIIEKIFGKEEGGDRNRDGHEADEVESETRVGPSCKKKRKFRSVENLYEVTKPLETR